MPRILSVTSSRADVSILLPVWRALSRPGIELHVLASGSHNSETAAALSLPAGVVSHTGGIDIGGASAEDAARGMASCAEAVARLLTRVSFDCVLLMGDRLDMIPAAFAALPFNIPLAHMHGGELSYGVIDERIRHAMTKLAHLHFTSHVKAAERLVRMGEEPWRVHVTGAPGLDSLANADVLAPAEFAQRLSLPFGVDFILVTVHPETNAEDAAAPMRATLDALDRCGLPALITGPNSDPGSQVLRSMIERFVGNRPNVVFRESLGPALYPSALRHAAAMLGNSSSGLIEAGYFGLPVIDVGGRQDGREFGPNVRKIADDASAVAAALREIIATKRRHPSYTPYGDGRASERVAAVLSQLPERMTLLRKVFHESSENVGFGAPWAAASEPRRNRA